MKIGILTFHAQINYGGVLQCFALQEVLKKMGHEVFVIDRWFSADNSTLKPYEGISLQGKVKLFLYSLIHRDYANRMKRYSKTYSFICNYLNLTKYSFTQWEDAPQKLDLDLIIVGSDQVWNGIWQDPSVFLLEGAPKVPAISYAASFAMPKIPEGLRNLYQNGFKRFYAISVRENEGLSIVNSFGEFAVKVLDPTLLLSKDEWLNFIGIKRKHLKDKSSKKRIVCYFINYNEKEILPILEEYSYHFACKIVILLQNYDMKSLGTSLSLLAANFKSNVFIELSAGPKDFVKFFMDADAIISDSFHALMFASIFKKNIRIIKPHEEVRANMFSRISEFSDQYIRGEVVVDNLNVALSTLEKDIYFNNDLLDKNRKESLDWLSVNICKEK